MTFFIDFLVALQFLTVAPPVIRRIFTPQELGRATAYYPLVGALIGGLLLLLSRLLTMVFPPLTTAALTLGVWVTLSGALHMDGLLDSLDGLLGGFTPESRLEIMRDERVGGFALSGGVIFLLAKFAAIASLSQPPIALFLAPVLGRWAMSLAIFAFPYVRPKGLGRDVKDNTTWKQFLFATLLTMVATAFCGWRGAFSLAAALLMAWATAQFILSRIPGLTGDCYGAINEIVEATVLLIFVVG